MSLRDSDKEEPPKLDADQRRFSGLIICTYLRPIKINMVELRTCQNIQVSDKKIENIIRFWYIWPVINFNTIGEDHRIY